MVKEKSNSRQYDVNEMTVRIQRAVKINENTNAAGMTCIDDE